MFMVWVSLETSDHVSPTQRVNQGSCDGPENRHTHSNLRGEKIYSTVGLRRKNRCKTMPTHDCGLTGKSLSLSLSLSLTHTHIKRESEDKNKMLKHSPLPAREPRPCRVSLLPLAPSPGQRWEEASHLSSLPPTSTKARSEFRNSSESKLPLFSHGLSPKNLSLREGCQPASLLHPSQP